MVDVMNFIPKGYLALRQAMERAGPIIVADRNGAELDRSSSSSADLIAI